MQERQHLAGGGGGGGGGGRGDLTIWDRSLNPPVVLGHIAW